MSTPPCYAHEPPPWCRYDLAEIHDPLEQPHPLDPETPRRLWCHWHYAVLIYPEPREHYRPALAALFAELGGGPLYNDVVRQLRWMRAVAIDPAPIRDLISAWAIDRDQHHRAITAAKRGSTPQPLTHCNQETHP